MRLTQIKLSGFKSFVDPTTIATPGQLVGIVGPNGCGKSNVIDAVRWVLGESKASALRGESMQDVIFNGAGDRKPVGRASVELLFDNSQGRVGGQWGQYAELSIKRVLARDSDSTYYVNNIPVRRRDIHDLFLGTGLGPRAYAIIEQGMISRVIEAKPEDLRVFLEEAAGVSKYKERRKETEGRLADTRDNLSRVEDIRNELGQQLAKLEAQAKVASEYRELETRLARAQQLLWFAKQQDAERQRERQVTDLANQMAALESLQAEVRAVEARLEALRNKHYEAGDALHGKQAAFYEASAEVSRLEQQLAFQRESETRLTQQVAQLTEHIAALHTQDQAMEASHRLADAELNTLLSRREQAALEELAASAALPELEALLAAALQRTAEMQQTMAESEQAIRVADAHRENAAKIMGQLAARKTKLDEEAAQLAAPVQGEIEMVRDQLTEETADLQQKQQVLDALRTSVQSLQAAHLQTSETWQAQSRRMVDLDARVQALAALQAKISQPSDTSEWLRRRELDDAARLWQSLDIEPGWEDALEAVLRERLNAIEIPALEGVLEWFKDGEPLPGRVAAFSVDPTVAPQETDGDWLFAKVRVRRAEVRRLAANWLHGVRCSSELAEAIANRHELGEGEVFVTAAGHLVSAQAVNCFAPDSELHGVLARQRELDELAPRLASARDEAAAARAALDAVEAELKARQDEYHLESLALGSQQRRCHDLELELQQLQQNAAAAEQRRGRLASERVDIVEQEKAELSARDRYEAELAGLRSALSEYLIRREQLREQHAEAEMQLARGRERVRLAEREAQQTQYAERSCQDKIAELARGREALGRQISQQRLLLDQLTSERQKIDWTPVENALQQQLGVRAGCEQNLSLAREHLERVAAELKAGDEERMMAEQRLQPARSKIEECRLKEQAAMLQQQQYAEQLQASGADLPMLPGELKSWGRWNTLPGEIERLNKAMLELGAVNLAALDEVATAAERKAYLDSQSADLTEAMLTLQNAIRQIDRESRELLQQTFDTVNENFARLFPILFGGGEARLVLTGEEILDSGVHVIAQPPGKRNTSIHLLSGGEKALTAISLVFALFQLNPAPFCLLDEVDAPLDDPNTDRFCAMVRDMAQVTQFLFISHNKITMEMANQLIGITMPDPGISRVVAVDIGEALELAESAA